MVPGLKKPKSPGTENGKRPGENANTTTYHSAESPLGNQKLDLSHVAIEGRFIPILIVDIDKRCFNDL